MKICDKCKRPIDKVDYIQVIFLGKLQQIPMMLGRNAFQFEFCTFNCFQEYFNLIAKERFEEEERRRKVEEMEQGSTTL